MQDIIAKEHRDRLPVRGPMEVTRPSLSSSSKNWPPYVTTWLRRCNGGRSRMHMTPRMPGKAVDRAIEQSHAQKPAAEKITPQLDRAVRSINKVSTAAESVREISAA